MVICNFNSSLVTGFQLIVHKLNSSDMNRLYTNESTGGHTPASVEVEESGMYQVTVFAIRGERGILNSIVEFRECVMVDTTFPATATTAFDTAFLNTTFVDNVASSIVTEASTSFSATYIISGC